MNKHTLINKIPRVLLWSTLLFAFFFNNAFANSPIHGAYSFNSVTSPDRVIVRASVDVAFFIKGTSPMLTAMNKVFVIACTRKICKPMLPDAGLGFYANSFSHKNFPVKQLTIIACDRTSCYKRIFSELPSLSSKKP